MMNKTRFSLRCAIATALVGAAGLATAAETSTQPAATLEEVVVTAQKRAERLIDVPVSVTEVPSAALTQENLVSLVDFFSRVPDLQYNGRTTYDLSVRGLTTGGATNPTLALLIDDVQFGSTLAAGLGNSRFPDIDPSSLESLEVLRGPQGTLYGAGSLGGLLKYVTKQPDTDKLSGRIEAGVASVADGSTGWNVRGSINLPFASNRAALLVSGFDREDPPYIDNVKAGFVGKDVNTTHIYGGRSALLLKPVDGLTITLSALIQKRDAEYSPSMQVETAPSGLPTYVPIYGKNNISLSSTSDVGDQQLYSARVEWNGGGFQLTSITAWGKSDGTNLQDLSAVFTFIPLFYGFPPGSAAVVDIDDISHTKKFSQEFRVGAKFGDVDWRGGVFYTKEDAGVDQKLTLYDPTGAFVAVPYDGKGPLTYKERAIFTDAVWHATPQWDLQAGVRYAKNDQTNGGGLTVIDPPIVPVFGPTSTSPIIDSSDSSVTFELSPTYHISPDLMTYVRVASGYRPGGPNTTLPGVPASFGPDKVVNYELGLKGFAMAKTVSFDIAVFQINWTDIQLQDTDAATQFTYTTNGGKARSRGLEATLEVKPTTGLTIAANATLLDAKLSEDLPALTGADSLAGSSGDRLPGSAKFAGNLSIQQEFPLTTSLTGSVGASATYVGSRVSDFVNTSALPAPRFDLPSYTQIDLRAGLVTTSLWRVDVYARNLTNQYGVTYANNRNGTSTATAVFLQPRTLGLSLSKSF